MIPKKPTILVVDDIQDNLTSLRAVIADAFPGAGILTALSGARGIELARTEDPDVILLDIVMPGMDGFEVCRRLKADECLKHIPVVFLTARQTDRESRIMALEFGAEAFLSKPLEESELTAQIRAMIKIKAAAVAQRREKERLSAMVEERTAELNRELAEHRKAEEALRESERQFQQAQKLESLGILAGGIAHDFNNILTIIQGHCFMARNERDPALLRENHIQQIEDAANRAAQLCHQMLAYAGKSSLVQSRINLRILLADMVKMLRSAIPKSITIELDLASGGTEITGDPAQIQQIVMNLIINSADAIGTSNGTIGVALAAMDNRPIQPEIDFFGNEIPAGRYTRLEVSDSGCGMDNETQRRIFEPFFTTKFTGRGLGMSAILGIIKAHNGALQLSSKPGAGTCFRIYFPVASTSCAADAAPSAKPAHSARKAGTVLLVDDEEALRIIGSSLLKAIGFSTMIASNGREALEIFRERGAGIDLVLLDMIMPEMGGVEAYREFRKLSPNIPIVICSGFNVEGFSNDIDGDDFAGSVQKPYNLDQLRDVLMNMLGDGGQGAAGQ